VDHFSFLIGLGGGLFFAGFVAVVIIFRMREKIIHLTNENEQQEQQAQFVEAQYRHLNDLAKDQFKSLAQDVLGSNSKQFLELAQQNLSRWHLAAEKQFGEKHTALETLLKPVSGSLEKLDQKIVDLEKSRQGAYESIEQYLKLMAQDQQKLREETSNLSQAMQHPGSRGRWGELQLKRVLDMAGMIEGVDYKTQVTSDRARPDVVVNLPGRNVLVIDSKTPMDSYLKSVEKDISPHARQKHLADHARHLRDHIKRLGAKAYWDQFDTPEFVVMFLPDEGYYRLALEQDPELLDYGVQKRVLLAAPMSMIALLRAVVYGWRQTRMADNAKQVAQLGDEIYQRLGVFTDHLSKLGVSLDRSVESYNKAVGSLERNVLVSARKLKDEYKVISDQGKTLDTETIDTRSRNLSSRSV